MKKLTVFLALTFLLAFKASCQNNENSGSLIAISAKSKAALQSGFGLIITLTNVETKETYKSKSMGKISSHSIITDLPKGNYQVTKISLPLGEMIYENWSENLTTFFGVLQVEEGKNYYLGNFNGKRKVGSQDVFTLKIEDESIPEKLIKKLKKKGYQIESSDFQKTYPYSKDELLIY